jgi:uncharacterized membrane protein
VRAITGLLKGGLVGGGLGYGLMAVVGAPVSSVLNYLLYGLIGALVGLVAGKPIWRQETIWTPIVKAIFGAAVCVGIYALVVYVLGDPSLGAFGLDASVSTVPYVLGAICGIIYGVFVEIDDGDQRSKEKPG